MSKSIPPAPVSYGGHESVLTRLKSCFEFYCGYFELSWRSVARKWLISKFFDFSWIWLGQPDYEYFGWLCLFCHFSIFLGNQKKSIATESCLEFYCGHFELSKRSVDWKIVYFKIFRFFGHFCCKKSRFLPFCNISRQPGKMQQKSLRILLRSFWVIIEVGSLKNGWFAKIDFLGIFGVKNYVFAIIRYFKTARKKLSKRRLFRILLRSFWAIIKVCSLKNGWFQKIFDFLGILGAKNHGFAIF